VIRSLLGLLAANACFLVAGAGLVRAAGYDVRRYAGVAYMAGVGTVGVVATLLVVAGLALEVWQVLVVCAVLGAIGFLGRPARETPARLDLRFAAVFGGALGVYLAILLAESVVHPLDTWDAWAKWTMKARALVLLDGLDPVVFANEAYRALVLDYPMLLPSLEAIDFRFMGAFDTLVIHVQFWLLLVGFLAAAYELLRDRVPQVVLWPALLLIGIAPGLAEQLATAYADAPLAFFFTLAALAGWRYVDAGDRRALAFAAMMAAASVATKPEGGPFVLALLALLVIFARLRRRPLLPLGLVLGSVLVAILPWRLWVSRHDIHSSTPIGDGFDPGYLAGRVDRVGPTLRSIFDRVVDGEWLFVLPLAAAAVALALWTRRGRQASLFAGGVMLAIFGSLVWAYWVQRPGIDWLLRTSVDRTVTTLLVCAGAFLPLIAAGLAEGAAVRRRSSDAATYTLSRDGHESDSRPEAARLRRRARS
jgi:hypothetical protein